jgi:hypothetical protein
MTKRGLLTIACLLGLVLLNNCADAADETWLVTTVGSYHFNRAKDYNERNFGLGYEHNYEDNRRGHLGFYKNSLNRTTLYALGSYTPYRVGEWETGVIVGIGTGYSSRPINGMFSFVTIREWENVGVNFLVHPAAIALQVKVKF